MRDEVRQQLQERYDFCCGYCGVRDVDAGAKLTVDHFLPRSHGGADDLENLVYCCHACNEYKGEYWHDNEEKRVLHPQNNTLSQHLSEGDDGRLYALTERGAIHIQRLHLNRPQLIANRLNRRQQADRLKEQRQQAAQLAEALSNNDVLKNLIAQMVADRREP